MTQVTLRPVTADDDGLLLEIYAGTRADELVPLPWDSAQKAQFVEMQFRAQLADYESRFPDAEHSIVLVDGTPAGRIWVDRRDGEIRLLDIALLPGRRDAGTGRTLLERLKSEAQLTGRPLRHSVYVDNADALRFYERLGFEVIEDFEMYVLMEWRPPAERRVTRRPG